MSSFDVRSDGASGTLVIEGTVTLDDMPALLLRLGEVEGEGEASVVSLRDAERADASVVAALVHWCRQRAGRELVGGRPDLDRLVELFSASAGDELPDVPKNSTLEEIGRQVVAVGEEGRAMLAFIGELLVTTWHAIRRPRLIRWVDVLPLVQRVGADGLLVVCLMTMLMGIVTGYQSAVQLQRFGADAFTADLVGIASVRELTPLMTAIVVAGRTGASFAAEIGTMKVSEEIDALRTLGFAPHGFLVIPRSIALAICLPVLTIIADVASILGAMMVVVLVLDTSASAFLLQTRRAVGLPDVAVGLLKSVAYAQAISLMACHHGLRARGGAEGVGRRTTSTVVAVLVLLVAIDAVITIAANQVGL